MINKYNQREYPYKYYNFTDDGCSVPGVLKRGIIDDASRFFNKECVQHDFGYRNFGDKIGLDRSSDRKWHVDKHFHNLMYARCATKGWLVKKGCQWIADAFYSAVDKYGKM